MNENVKTENAFFGWIRAQNIVRVQEKRWLAGVAAGIAARMKIDPLIVRAVFVVLAIIGGPGIILYVLGWLFLPGVDGRIHVQETLRRKGSFWPTAVAAVLALWLALWVFGGVTIPLLMIPMWDVWSGPIGGDALEAVIVLAIVSVLIYGLYRIFKLFVKKDNQDGGAAEGVAVAEKQKLSLSASSVLITIALAVVFGAVAALLVLSTGGQPVAWFGALPLTALMSGILVATVVFSVAMIIAGIRGRKSGVLGFFGFLGVVTVGIAALLPPAADFQFLGAVKFDPKRESSSVLAIGSAQLDLREYDKDFSVIDYSAEVGLGEIYITAPETRPTTILVSIGAGDIANYTTPYTEFSDGIKVNQRFTFNESGKGQPLTVSVKAGLGSVFILNGSDVDADDFAYLDDFDGVKE